MKMDRVWAMPNKRTFQIKPIKKLLDEELGLGFIVDPFPFEAKEDCFDVVDDFIISYKGKE